MGVWVTMFSLTFSFIFLVSVVEGNLSVQQLDEFKIQVKSEIEGVEVMFRRKEEEMKARIDRVEAHCVNMEEKICELESRNEKMEKIMQAKNKIIQEIQAKIKILEERVEMWEKKEKERKDGVDRKVSELTEKLEEKIVRNVPQLM